MNRLPIYLLLPFILIQVCLGSANYNGEEGIGVVEEPLAVVQQVPELSYRERLDIQVSRGEIRAVVMEATAYTHTGEPCFSGVMPYVGVIAVDPDVIPLGSEVYVEGYGKAIAEDTGGLIKGRKIDLFMDLESECNQFGIKDVKVYILHMGRRVNGGQ